MGTEAGYEDVMNLQKTKTMKETDRKCPQCGGVMDYDPALSKLHCPYCDYTEEIKVYSSGNFDAEKTKADFAT